MVRRRPMPHSHLGLLVLPLALGLGAAPAVGRVTCLATTRCDRPDLVADVRDAIEAACPCAEQPSSRAYRRCAKRALKERQRLLGKGVLPKPCRKDVVRAYKNAVCGRPDAVPCNRTNRRGRTKCVVVAAAHCPVEPGRSSPCGAFTSCLDACAPEGGCPTTPPTTVTSTTVMTSTTSSIATSSTVMATTTTTTPGGTTTSTLPTTLPCADVNLGDASPLTIMGTTVGAGNDVEPPPACLSIPLSGGEDVLYEWTAPAAGTYVFDTRQTPFDSVVYVLDGCGGTVLACNDDPEGFGVLGSRTEVALGAGQTVLVVVDSASTSGSFTLAITGPFGPDDCCIAHAAPGCDDAATQTCVCGADALCCSDGWDGLCEWRAIDRCDAVCE